MRNTILKLLLILVAYSSGLYAATLEELAPDPRGQITAAAPVTRVFERRERVEAAGQPRTGIAKRKGGKGFGAGGDAEVKGVEMTLNPHFIRTPPHTVVAHAGDVVIPVGGVTVAKPHETVLCKRVEQLRGTVNVPLRVFNSIRVNRSFPVIDPGQGDDARIRVRLNAYMRTHLDAPFNKKEKAAAAVLGGLLAYGGIQGVAPAVALFVNWGMAGPLYDSLSLNQQAIFDLFSLGLRRALQPGLGLYGFARGDDLVNRARYAWNGQFADLFAPAKKGVAVAGYILAGVAAGALAANEVSVYYALGEMADVFTKGSFNPAAYADQYTTLGIYTFVELLDPMVTAVAGIAKPKKSFTRKTVREKLEKAAQYINRLDDKETASLYERFTKAASDPVEQLRILTIVGKDEKLQKTPKYQYLVSIGAPLVIGGLVGYAQWLFARQLPARFDVLPGTDLDMGVGYAAAAITSILKGGLGAVQVRSLGKHIKDVFACNKKWRTSRSNRKSCCYEVMNTLLSAAHSSILAVAVGFNIYSLLDPNATADQEYDPRRQWVITLVSAYALAEIANHTIRFAQGNAYLPEVVTGITKGVKDGTAAGAKTVKNAIAARLPDCVKDAYDTAKERCVAAKTVVVSYVPGWFSRGCSYVSSGCGYAVGKVNHFLTGRAPGEDMSATQRCSEMIGCLEQGQHLAQAGTDTIVVELTKAIAQ